MNNRQNKFIYLAALTSLLLPLSAACQSNIDPTGFVEKRFINANNESLRYLLYVPNNYDAQKKYPLVLWLHGGGARGDNPKTILSWGDEHGPLFFTRADNQANYPCFVLAPQCPAGKFWADPFSDQLLDQGRLVIEMLDSIEKEFHIDSKRLYLIGISMGGYATWDIVARHPNRFAAAMPICGGGNPAEASQIVNTSVWAFHGDEDEMVDVRESRAMIEAVKKAGGKPKYSEYKGIGHNSWVQAFKEPDFLTWIFSQSRR